MLISIENFSAMEFQMRSPVYWEAFKYINSRFNIQGYANNTRITSSLPIVDSSFRMEVIAVGLEFY